MKKLRLKAGQGVRAYLWLAPALTLTIIFKYYSFFKSVFQSFFLVNNKGANVKFVGLRNYMQVLQQPDFQSAVWTTIKLTVISVPVSLAISLALALLAQKRRRLSPVYESMFTLPMAMSVSVVVMIFQFMLNPTLGIINQWMGTQISWFYDTKYLLPALIILQVWLNIGFEFIYYLAALRGIPPEFLECASLDGAHGFQYLRKIVLPLISPTTFFLLCTEFAKSMMIVSPLIILQSTTQNNTVTTSVKTIIYYMYNYAFQRSNYSYAYVASTIGFLLTLAVMMVSFRFEKKGVHYA